MTRPYTTPALLCLCLVPAVAAAHGVDGSSAGGVWGGWTPDPWVVAALALTGGLYGGGLRRLWRAAGTGRGIRPWRALAFLAGWLVLVLALAFPVDALADVAFSVHMVQHQLLMLVAAPLLVLGRPVAVWTCALPRGGRRRVGRAAKVVAAPWRLLSAPLAAFTVQTLALWIWHAPILFQAAIGNRAIHTAEHLSFLLAAVLFWWVLDRRSARGDATVVLYLFATAVHSSLLAALLTFSNRVWYPVYQDTTPVWGLTPLEDQQLGGLIMWVPGGLIYLAAALGFFAVLLRPSAAVGGGRTRLEQGGG